MKYIFIILIAVSAAFAKSNVEMELIPEYKTVMPGKPFSIIVKAKVKDDWYIYWRNPGDAGLPTKFTWDLPAGVKLNQMKWPTPDKIFFKDMASYGYKNEAAFYFNFTTDTSIQKEKTLLLELEANWLECKEKCIPGSSKKKISLPVEDAQPEMNNQFLQSSEDKYPTEDHGFRISAIKKNDKISINISYSQEHLVIAENIIFMPYDNGIFNDGSKQRSSKSENGFSLIVPLDDLRIEEPKKIEGLLKAEGSFYKDKNQNAIIIKSNIINNSEKEQE